MNTSTDILEALKLIDSQNNKIKGLETTVSDLQAQLAWFNKQIFGKRSERIVPKSPDEMFFPGFEFPELPPVETKQVSGHIRTTPPKTIDPYKLTFPSDLPVEQTILDLDENEKSCPNTGQPLIKIGEDVSQKLAYKPGSYFIKEIIRFKYASPLATESSIFTRELPDTLLPKSKADESLLAEILVRKFADHLPLYRQSEILKRDGINISRQLLSQWVVKCGLALKPLYNEMYRMVMESNNVFIDEVPVDMLKPGKGSVQQSYMWVLVGGKEINPAYRIYSFRTNRRHENAAELLKDYSGVLHSDKYGAYENLAQKKKFVWCPCWAHIRRKFLEADGGDPDLCRTILRKIKHLFMLERVAWNRPEDERLRIRQEKEAPIVDEIIHLVKERLTQGKLLAKSKFREALGYLYSLIPFLKNYTQHPYAHLDNNIAERAVRPLAMGRKNWLFLGNEEGGEAAAIILSLVQSCRALNINPREYLEDVMRRLMSHSNQKLIELLPDHWVKVKNSQ